jgi:hypothetical protein
MKVMRGIMAGLLLLSAPLMRSQSVATAEQVDPAQVFDVVRGVLGQHHLQVDVFNEPEQWMTSGFEEYSAHFMRYRTRYHFELKGTTLTVTLQDKQQQLTSGWGNPQLPSKGADDKLVQQMAAAIKANSVPAPASAPATAAPEVGHSSRGVTYDLVGCVREEGRVDCRIKLTNTTQNDMEYHFGPPSIGADDSGTRNEAHVSLVAGKYNFAVLASGITATMRLVFQNVSPEVTSFRRLEIKAGPMPAGTTAGYGNTPSAVFQNVPITNVDAADHPQDTLVRGGATIRIVACYHEDPVITCHWRVTNPGHSDLKMGFPAYAPMIMDADGNQSKPHYGSNAGGYDNILHPDTIVNIFASFEGMDTGLTSLARVVLVGNDADDYTAKFTNVPVAPKKPVK